ncbi:MAG: PhoX family phosphatase [Pseudomonadota bacterium]|nr:PhoX family phosphatase [Pseudomonadota bacterium]
MGHHPVEDSNRSSNRTLESIISAKLSRRRLLTGSASAATLTVLGSIGLTACSDSDSDSSGPASPGDDITMNPESLGFEAVPLSLEDRVRVPTGYRAQVLYAKGDALSSSIPEFRNDGTDVDYDQRCGDENDGMHFFGLSENGQYDPSVSDRGILCVNHENLEDATLHQNGVTAATDNNGVRPKIEVDREMAAHGVSCVEVRKIDGNWTYVKDSTFNRRVTFFTELQMSGPVAGSDIVKTRTSPDGQSRFGTMNNCANGFTPWGTYLAAEENWWSYFSRPDDTADRTDKENVLLLRYGISPGSKGFSHRDWDTLSGDVYERFRPSVSGATASDDFRNEPILHGYITEIDPFRPAQKPKVRTAFGRLAHEGAWPAPVEPGKPLVFYSGDDSRGEYIYKYVSNQPWDPADADRGLAAGDKYLDDGKLYAGVFNEDGTGEWREISTENPDLAGDQTYEGFTYQFSGAADLLAGARLAADILGATKMDRPEWAKVHPLTGEVYLTLTNNRTSVRPVSELDPANPRAYEDNVGEDRGRDGNANGHIIRWKEAGGDHSATTFEWDIFLFGADADADASNINVSGLTADNEFSSPDGLMIDHRGVMWIQTDDGALRDKTNNQMLVAIPGQVGDGKSVSITSSVGADTNTIETFVGRSAAEIQLKRFFVGPKGCEITGIYLTPDARALFLNVQHPGEDGSSELFNTDNSVWPAASRDATQFGEAGSRPRSATVVVTREDGGEIAL